MYFIATSERAPASEHQRASWEHTNLSEKNLNIPLARIHQWTGLATAQDCPTWQPYLENISIYGEGFAIFGRPHARNGLSVCRACEKSTF